MSTFEGQSLLNKNHSKMCFFGIDGLDRCNKDDLRSFQLQLHIAFKDLSMESIGNQKILKTMPIHFVDHKKPH